MANYLITGYWGEPHVTAENNRGFNAAVFGAGRFVLPVGENLRAAYIGNSTVRLYDGKLLDGGALAGIPAGKYVDLLIPEAGQGRKRNDLIVFQYRKDPSSLIESGDFIVISGTETTGTAVDPPLAQQDILSDTATADQMPLYRVEVNGATIGNPVQLFTVAQSTAAITALTTRLAALEASVQTQVNTAKTYAKGAAGITNLLDNSDFRNPVNQRDAESYRGLKYSIDRWVVPSENAALTVGSGFVLIQNDGAGVEMFTQRLKPGTLKIGKTYTAVIRLNTEVTYIGNGVCTSGTVNLTSSSNDVYAQITPGSSYDMFRLNVNAGKYARIVYCALYEGAFTEDTLPAYQPKGFAAEYLECCRYFYLIPHLGAHTYPGYITGATNARCTVMLPVEMRIQPTFSIGTIDHVSVFTNSGAKSVTSVEFIEMYRNSATFNFPGSYTETGTPCTVRFGHATAVATLSADL